MKDEWVVRKVVLFGDSSTHEDSAPMSRGEALEIVLRLRKTRAKGSNIVHGVVRCPTP